LGQQQQQLWQSPPPHIISYFSFGLAWLVGRIGGAAQDRPVRLVAVRVCVCLLSFLTRVVQSATPVSDESVSVGWWCGRLLLYFTLSLVLSLSPCPQHQQQLGRPSPSSSSPPSCIVSHQLIFAIDFRSDRFILPSVPRLTRHLPGQFFSALHLLSPCHSYRRRLCFRLTIELPIALLRVPVCIWYDVGTRDGRHCR
jgi:hypothetical protein